MSHPGESVNGGIGRGEGRGMLKTLRRAVTLPTLVLGLSLITNILLARKVYQLRSHGVKVNSLQQPDSKSRVELPAGTKVPPIVVDGFDGDKKTISYEGGNRPTVLFVITPKCTWCLANIDNMNALVKEKSDSYRFIGLSLTDEGVSDFVAKNKPAFPIYTGLSDDIKETYGMGGTPQTVVVSTDARVVHNWVGAYNEVLTPQVESFFKLQLPGLRP